MPGSITSRITRSKPWAGGASAVSRFSASVPSGATSTSQPSISKLNWIPLARFASSSTIRMRATGAGQDSVAPGPPSGSSITPGRVMVKVDPRSGPGLSAETVPRCPFTTDFTMKRPRPVPVRLRRTSRPMR